MWWTTTEEKKYRKKDHCPFYWKRGKKMIEKETRKAVKSLQEQLKQT